MTLKHVLLTVAVVFACIWASNNVSFIQKVVG